MSEVKRYLIQKTPIGTMMKPNPEGNWVASEDFDRVTAERDAALRQLETITADRDAEKLMKAKARIQRDVQTDKAIALQERLTAEYDRVDLLEGLVGEVLDAVGREPLDLDAVLRLRARMRAALNPAEGGGDEAI